MKGYDAVAGARMTDQEREVTAVTAVTTVTTVTRLWTWEKRTKPSHSRTVQVTYNPPEVISGKLGTVHTESSGR